jgi:hypothetical protein
MMQSAVDVAETAFDKDAPKVVDQVKAFIYIGNHNLITLANTFNFSLEYLPWASQLRMDLYRHYFNTSQTVEDDPDYVYNVAVTFNGKRLQGLCGVNTTDCSFVELVDFAK